MIPPTSPRSSPFTFRHDIDPTGYVHYSQRHGEIVDSLVQVYREETIVQFNSPVRFTGLRRLFVRLSSSAFDGIHRRPVSTSLIHREASWFQDELEDDAIQLAAFARDRYQFSLRIPDLTDVTWALLREQTSSTALSDKGQCWQLV